VYELCIVVDIFLTGNVEEIWITRVTTYNLEWKLNFLLLFFYSKFQCVGRNVILWSYSELKYCNIWLWINIFVLEIRSIISQFVRANTWVARAYCVVCSVCWFSIMTNRFSQQIAYSGSYGVTLFTHPTVKRVCSQFLKQASLLSIHQWMEDVWIFI